jgi:glutathione S-transferase
LTLHSLADGILEAAVANRYETVVRPEDKRWPDWTRGMMAKINDSLAELEREWTGHIRSNLDIGTIAVGCTLGYLDFRYPSLDWRGANPKLAKWYERFSRRPSMKATAPHA